jgi:predicted nucleotidyltransferase component of viral defense system
VAAEPGFALKGGTAINLFIRDFPRLSVDIDLTWLPDESRETALNNIRHALQRIGAAARQGIPGLRIVPSARQDALRLLVSSNDAQIKIEVSPVLRGTVFPPVEMEVCERVEDLFGFARVPVLSFADLYAGKICAALDRQHPRDLFDIKLLFEHEGLSRELIRTFLVYLISHNRPMAELLDPKRADIRSLFEGEFARMTREPVSLEELEGTRERLISDINATLSETDKRFLLSFKARTPDWSLLDLEGGSNLPAVRWKLQNLGRMSEDKHREALEKLSATLGTSHDS